MLVSQQKRAKNIMPLIEITIESVRKSAAGERLVVLSEGERKRYLPIFAEPTEADAIVTALKNDDSRMYLTHNLLCLVIDTLSARVGRTIIYDVTVIQDRVVFEAKAILDTADSSLKVKCRAPDAIAVAVLTGSPIFVEQSVMEKAGILGNVTPVAEPNGSEVETVDTSIDSGKKLTETPEETYMLRTLTPHEVEHTEEEIEIEVTGVFSSLMGSLNIVNLSDKEQNWLLPIRVGAQEVDAIHKVLHNLASPGPRHLLCRVIDTFSYKISKAIISEVRNEVLLARLIFDSGSKCLGVQCRFSDAIVVALIAKAPVFATESVLHEVGTSRVQRDRIRQTNALVDVISAPSWKFWISQKRKSKAYNALSDIAENDNDQRVREAAAQALKRA